MEGAQLRVQASTPELPLSERSRVPFAQVMVGLTKQDHISLKWAARYWKAQYDRVAAREAALKRKIEAQQAHIRELTHRLYGKKSEKGGGTKLASAPSAKRRGQQPARPGHGRTVRPQLPVIEEVKEVPAEHRHCPACGMPYEEFPGAGPGVYTTDQTQALPQRLSVSGHPWDNHGTTGPAGPAENLIGRVRVDRSLARQISLVPSDPSFVRGFAAAWGSAGPRHADGRVTPASSLIYPARGGTA
jgi:hypothetical protein